MRTDNLVPACSAVLLSASDTAIGIYWICAVPVAAAATVLTLRRLPRRDGVVPISRPLELVGGLVDRLQVALVLELPAGRRDVRVPDLREPAPGELDVALAERRLDLQQEHSLLDVQHLWHDRSTVAVGTGPGGSGLQWTSDGWGQWSRSSRRRPWKVLDAACCLRTSRLAGSSLEWAMLCLLKAHSGPPST